MEAPVDNQIQGHGVQIVNLTSNHTYQLNEEALKKILLREDVKDLPVVLVSVAGAYRGGKSFLLNFFLRYLTSPEEIRDENGTWLGAENNTLAGFSWRGGADPHTTGILMWSEPFIATLPSDEKVAVLLMDTQGTFDSGSTVRDCSTIFALSTLVSSVQIYNIKENIKEDDLQHLQLFTQYGKAIKNEDGTKPFQVLEFLIRDWQYEYDHEYGQKGGEELLEDRLKIKKGMAPELSELRQHIRSCFEKVTCFLMPHPGRSVRKKNFSGKLSELDEEFIDALKELVPSIFAPANLTPKLMNGEKVKARDLFTYIQSYMMIFNSDKAPSVNSIMKATSQAALLAAVQDGRELYEARMARLSSDAQSLPSHALEEEHRRALADAHAAFTDKKTMATKKDSNAYLAQLTHELEERLPQFVLINEGKLRRTIEEAKQAYDAVLVRVKGKNLLCLHPLDLDEVHGDAMAAALTIFDAKRKRYPNEQDLERIKFIQVLQKELENLQVTNEQHNKMFESSVRMEFSTEMESLLSKDPPLDDDQFTAKYEEAKTKTLAAFESKRNKPSKYTEDPYKTSLLEAMSGQFLRLETINRSKNRRAFQRSIDFYSNYMKMFWNPDQCCLHPDDLKTNHQLAKNQALGLFHPNKDDNDFEKQLLSQILDFKYYELKNLNDSLNEIAVRDAVRKYIAYMDEMTAASPWWLLVVPIIVTLAKLPRYRREAKEKALLEFYNHRRDTMNPAYDPFLEKLNGKIDEAARRY
ncbi:atlastin isoform X2 [Manduca sexta]|uniref:atlastin isoform X2 n=1 Tax=Manduca sexta TaxID=7130 RepID=UPI0011824B45|nr:atlastin isoform X2 [Manduca sexta]